MCVMDNQALNIPHIVMLVHSCMAICALVNTLISGSSPCAPTSHNFSQAPVVACSNGYIYISSGHDVFVCIFPRCSDHLVNEK
jgi:hypothetical protein